VHAANWFGLVAPARTPEAVVTRLADALAAIVASPSFQEELRTRGAEVLVVTQSDFARFLDTERTRWSTAVGLVLYAQAAQEALAETSVFDRLRSKIGRIIPGL
jgi:tripartite-type tricarboxylate transporter receptor subunit TctC